MAELHDQSRPDRFPQSENPLNATGPQFEGFYFSVQQAKSIALFMEGQPLEVRVLSAIAFTQAVTGQRRYLLGLKDEPKLSTISQEALRELIPLASLTNDFYLLEYGLLGSNRDFRECDRDKRLVVRLSTANKITQLVAPLKKALETARIVSAGTATHSLLVASCLQGVKTYLDVVTELVDNLRSAVPGVALSPLLANININQLVLGEEFRWKFDVALAETAREANLQDAILTGGFNPYNLIKPLEQSKDRFIIRCPDSDLHLVYGRSEGLAANCVVRQWARLGLVDTHAAVQLSMSILSNECRLDDTP